MVEEIREEGYETIRQYIDSSRSTPTDWDWVELRDDTNDPVTRIQISGDTRVAWQHNAGDQVLELEIEIQGDDSDIPLGTTFTGSALYNTSSDGNELSYDSFADALIETEGDILVVTHQIETPQL